MSTLTGAPTLGRLVLRRDRIRIAVWVVALLALAVSTVASIRDIFPTSAELVAYARVVDGNSAVIAMQGPVDGIGTLGGRVTWELLVFGAVAVALMSMMLVGRQTRTEEETGRTELVRAAVVGRHAQLIAALVVVGSVNIVIGAVVAVSLIGTDLPVTGSLLLGAALAGVGLVFAGITAVAAQVTEHTRTAYGITAGILGAAFALRAFGDVGDNAVSWLSPIGWAQAVDPYTADRTWVLVVPLVASVVLGSLAVGLNGRRDVGAGLVASRPGSPDASPRLGSPFGLAVRLQRTAVIGWASGVFIGGLAFGSIANSAEDLIGDNEQLREFLAQSGATSITDSFLATMLVYMALVGAGFAVQSVLRLRGEETALRAEPVLATAVSRWAWAGSHLTVAVGGTVLVLGVAGLGVGLSHGLAVGDVGQAVRLTVAAMALVPAVWVLVGIAMALFGLAPRATVLAWAALAACVVIGMFGPILQLPDAVIRLTPFGHVPQVPAVEASAAPLVILTLVAAALVAAGLAGFRRRDVG